MPTFEDVLNAVTGKIVGIRLAARVRIDRQFHDSVEIDGPAPERCHLSSRRCSYAESRRSRSSSSDGRSTSSQPINARRRDSRAGMDSGSRSRAHSRASSQNTFTDFPNVAPAWTGGNASSAASFVTQPEVSNAQPRFSLSSFRHPVYYETGDPTSRPRRPYTLPLPSEDEVGDPKSLRRIDSWTTARSETMFPELCESTVGSPKSNRSNGAQSAFSGIGRFALTSDIDTEYIKAQLDRELSAPGNFNFYGPDTFLGPHPLEKVYLERCRSEQTTTAGARTSGDESIAYSVQERLARKLRPKTETYVTKDGCTVMKGFDLSWKYQNCTPFTANQRIQTSSPAQKLNSTTVTAERRNERPVPTNHFSDDALVESNPPARLAPRGPSRRVTWDERTYDTGPKLEAAVQPKRAMSDLPKPRVRIVGPEDAESAIASDDEDDDFDPAVIIIHKPTKDVSPPTKGILKNTIQRSSNDSASPSPKAISKNTTQLSSNDSGSPLTKSTSKNSYQCCSNDIPASPTVDILGIAPQHDSVSPLAQCMANESDDRKDRRSGDSAYSTSSSSSVKAVKFFHAPPRKSHYGSKRNVSFAGLRRINTTTQQGRMQMR
jgi:hypothetical protein